jgi:hypothetical protein
MTEKAIVSVKGGDNVGVQMICELGNVVDREKAKMGLLITLAEPTANMRKEAVSSGYFRTEAQGDFAKIQIVTIGELLGETASAVGRARCVQARQAGNERHAGTAALAANSPSAAPRKILGNLPTSGH